MFGVPVKGMPAEVRRRAKAINFGIVYGISAFGLANQLGIEREEAGAYIKKYFERFPGIRDYIEEIEGVREEERLCATRCSAANAIIRISRASNASIRAFNERAAVNARLQGTAADIIRRAMIRMDDALGEEEAVGADAAAGARRTGLRSAGRRSRTLAAGDQGGDGRRAAPGGVALGAVAGRGARGRQLGRRALTK